LALLETGAAQFMLLVVIVTMFLTPVLAYLGHKVGQWLRIPSESPHLPATAHDGQTVIIGGFGRVGKMLAHLLEEQRVPYVAVDNDADLVAMQRAKGTPIFFGDASQPDVLHHLGIENAAAFATTMDAPETAEHVIRAIHQTSPHVPIIARARDVEHARLLRACGARSAVPEAMEASLELCEQLLVRIGFGEDVARTVVDKSRTWQMEIMEGSQEPTEDR
jgi:CPA2 family monovalent cation:H+ antiporter-2